MADPEAIYNWQRLDNRITTSGQPTEKQLADIHALGMRHIVNLGLHTHEKALPDESASVSRLGMTYTDPRNFLDASVSPISGHGSIAGPPIWRAKPEPRRPRRASGPGGDR